MTTVCLDHSLPIASSDDLVQQYEDMLQANPNIKVLVVGEHLSRIYSKYYLCLAEAVQIHSLLST